MEIIQVTDINKRYGKKQVLSGACFCVEKGECIGIVGANGCGKSTLLGILSGSHKASSGEILYDGKNPMNCKSLFSAYVGYVPQQNPLLENLTVLDNLRFWYCESDRSLKQDMVSGVPARLGLALCKNDTVERLSGGMRKRLSIACALAKNPPILILDEPGSSLDIICKEDIKSYLETYLKQGGTVIITSHEEAELSLCSRMYLLQEGILTELPDKPMGKDLMDRMRVSHG